MSTGSSLVPDLTNLTMGGWLAGLFGVKSRGKGGEILSLIRVSVRKQYKVKEFFLWASHKS